MALAIVAKEIGPEASRALRISLAWARKERSRNQPMEVISPQIPRRRGRCKPRFTADEDAVIMKAKMVDGSKSWIDIARRLKGRTTRQCRDRWNHYLSPEISSGPWTPEEDRFLVEKINELGTAWAEIRPSFKGRSTNDVRNRWLSHLKFKTVHDGTKFTYTESDPNFADPNREECDECETHPKEWPLTSVQDEVGSEASRALHSSTLAPEEISRNPPMEVIPAETPRSHGRRKWRFTADEDAVIMKAKMADPSESWIDIAKRVKGRTAEQCRNHWNHYVSRELCSEPWTPEEDRFLVEKINEIGTAWRAMRPFFNGRRERDIRDRWHAHVKFKTVHDGMKFIYTESDSGSADPNRKECDEREETTRTIVQDEVVQEATRTFGMNQARPPVLELTANAENETKSVWDQMTTDESTDERFLFSQSELDEAYRP
jgi:hypothetical protein